MEAEKIKKRWQQYTENYTKKVRMTQTTMMLWYLTYSQTSWSVRSSGPYEGLPQTKLVDVMEFQLSYF